MTNIIPYNLQLAVWGSSTITSSMALSLPPIEQVVLPDFNTLKNHVTNHSKSHSFIILYLDGNNQPPNSNIEDLKKEANVFAIFICIKLKHSFTFNGGNVYPVTKQFITQKITSSVIQFFEQASAKLLRLNQIVFAARLKQRANDIRQQSRLSTMTIEASHVLIIPLNVTEEQYLEFQERVIDTCNNLCGEYEPTVCTLGDYFAWNEDPALFGDEGAAIKCNFIKRISGIRLYLMGNEQHNIHSLSQTLFESESNNCSQNNYYKTYTFVEYQPVTDRTKQNLLNVLGSGWESTKIELKRLEHLQNDIHFANALEWVNVSRNERTVDANTTLNQQATDPSDDSIEISAAYHSVQQAVTGFGTQNAGADQNINDAIQGNSP